MKPTTRLFLSSIAAGCTALLISCASTQITTQNRESMLVASGFKVITPKTAAQKQKLQNLPAGRTGTILKTKPIVGYGDITPVSRIARWLAAMEAMTGLLLLAFPVARLVSLYSSANLRIRDDVARASRPCRGSPKVL